MSRYARQRDRPTTIWRRIGALSFVVIAIVFAIKSEAHAAGEWRRPQLPFNCDAEAKFHNVPRAIGENVLESCPSPKEQITLVVNQNIGEVLPSDINDAAWNVSGWAQNKWLVLSFLNHGPKYKISFILNPCCANERIDRHGWGSSRISPRDPQSQSQDSLIFVHQKLRLGSQWEDISLFSDPVIERLLLTNIAQNNRELSDVYRSDCSNDHGKQGDQSIPKRRVACNFFDLSERDQIYVIRGAIMIVLVCAGIAAIVIACCKTV